MLVNTTDPGELRLADISEEDIKRSIQEFITYSKGQKVLWIRNK